MLNGEDTIQVEYDNGAVETVPYDNYEDEFGPDENDDAPADQGPGDEDDDGEDNYGEAQAPGFNAFSVSSKSSVSLKTYNKFIQCRNTWTNTIATPSNTCRVFECNTGELDKDSNPYDADFQKWLKATHGNPYTRGGSPTLTISPFCLRKEYKNEIFNVVIDSGAQQSLIPSDLLKMLNRLIFACK